MGRAQRRSKVRYLEYAIQVGAIHDLTRYHDDEGAAPVAPYVRPSLPKPPHKLLVLPIRKPIRRPVVRIDVQAASDRASAASKNAAAGTGDDSGSGESEDRLAPIRRYPDAAAWRDP